MEKYELQGRECLTIQAILKNQTQQCFSVSIIPKIFERKVREYPSVAPMKKETSPWLSLRYKEWESPVLHIEKVSKNIGEHDQLQGLVENFMG